MVSASDQFQTCWLSPEILAWPAVVESRDICPSPLDSLPHLLREPYEGCNYAHRILSGSAGKQEVISAVTALNRAVDFRDKLLDDIYAFKSIPGAKSLSSKGIHGIMDNLGLIRQRMKMTLDSVRNNLLHIPTSVMPDLASARDLCEFVWYYLRSTDHLAAAPPYQIDFSEPPMEHSRLWGKAVVTLNRDPWEIVISGDFPNCHISQTPLNAGLQTTGSFCFSSETDCWRATDCLAIGPGEIQFSLIRNCLNALDF